MAKWNITHGKSSTPMYNIWSLMLHRCLNNHDVRWKSYGGRGIKVCVRWWKFENFLTDMGERPVGMMLERIDNNGNYEPGNCRWATNREQSRNRRNNVMLTMNGETKLLVEWAKILGMNYHTLYCRFRKEKGS